MEYTFLFLCVVAAAIWPWKVLHGAARVAFGIPWTGAIVAIVIAVIAARVRQTGSGSGRSRA